MEIKYHKYDLATGGDIGLGKVMMAGHINKQMARSTLPRI